MKCQHKDNAGNCCKTVGHKKCREKMVRYGYISIGDKKTELFVCLKCDESNLADALRKLKIETGIV